MIAGLSWTETRAARPGAMLDLFVLRRAYDDEQHGIKRTNKGDDHDISAEDEAQFEGGSGENGGTGDQDHTGG